MDHILTSKLLLLTCIYFAKGVVETPFDYQIKNLEHNPGLYFEKIDQVRIISKEWKLLIVIDIERYLGQKLPGQELLQTLLNECSKMMNIKICQQDLRWGKIQDLVTESRGIQAHLNNILKETSSKQKRAPLLGFIGTIAGDIFGTMDYNDHEHITKEIDRLYQDQRQITHLIGNSTHLIQAEIDNLRKISTENVENTKIIEKQLGLVLSEHDKMNDRIANFEFEQHLRGVGPEVEYAANKFVDSLHKVVQTLEDAKHGKLNPFLINNQQIIEASKEIEKEMANNIFPLSREKLDLSLLSKISKIETGVNKKRFLVIVKIPLLSRESMDLYHMIPCKVPQTIQVNRKIMAFVKPNTEYIIHSKTTSRFALIIEKFLKNCILLENCLACPNLPLRKPSKENMCEYNLLTNKEVKPTHDLLKNCDIRITDQMETTWTELTGNQGWLYSTAEPERLEITCNGRASKSITLQGTGILKINENCTAETPYITLNSNKLISSELPEIHGIPMTINISEMAPVLLESPKIPNFLTGIKHNVISNFTFVDGFDESMRKTIEQANEIGLHHQEEYYHRIFSITNCILGFLTIGVGFTIYCLVKQQINPCKLIKCCCKVRKPREYKFSRRTPTTESQIQQVCELPITTITLPTMSPRLVPTRTAPTIPRIEEVIREEITDEPITGNPVSTFRMSYT